MPNMYFNLSYLLRNVRPRFYPNWNHDQNFDTFELRSDYFNFNINFNFFFKIKFLCLNFVQFDLDFSRFDFIQTYLQL